MKKVVAGLISLLEPGIYDYMDNKTDPAEGARLRGFLEHDNAAVCDVVGKYFDIVNPGPVASQETADKAIQAFKDADVQLLFVVSLFWSSDKPLLKILRTFSNMPIIYWCYTPTRSLPDHMVMSDLYRRSGAVGAMQNCAPLTKMGREYSMVFGTPDDPQLEKDIADYAKAYEVLFAMNGMKIGQIGGRYEEMTGTYVDEFRLLNRFGIDLVHITPGMVEKAAEELDDAEVQAYVDELKSKYPVVGVTDEGLFYAARVSMATAKAAMDRGVSVMAVEDFNTVVMDHFKTRPQLWVPGLRERGMVASMEGDVIAALSVWISRHLGETTPMYTEMFTFDLERNALLMGHAGILDPELAKPDSVKIIRDAEMDGICESEGAWLHFRGKLGPVVVTSLFGMEGDYTSIMFTGESIENEILDIHANMLVKIDTPMRSFFQQMMKRGTNQHMSVSYDDIASRWIKFCEIAHIDLKVIE